MSDDGSPNVDPFDTPTSDGAQPDGMYTLSCPNCDWEFSTDSTIGATLHVLAHAWSCNE